MKTLESTIRELNEGKQAELNPVDRKKAEKILRDMAKNLLAVGTDLAELEAFAGDDKAFKKLMDGFSSHRWMARRTIFAMARHLGIHGIALNK